VKIVFTRHALDKFVYLKELGVVIKKQHVVSVLKNPEHLDDKTDYPNLIASGKLDEERVLRVVYRVEDETMIVITFYPARKGRYYA